MQLKLAARVVAAALLFASPSPAQNDDKSQPSEAPADKPEPTSTEKSPDTDQAAPPPKSSDITVRASAEVGAYLDSTATGVVTPSIGGSIENPTAGWAVNGHYLVDVVSAASPDIISTASPNFREIRHAGSVGGRYKPGDFGVAANAAISYTPDYLSLSAGAQLTQDVDDKNLTLLESYGYGHDVIGRTGTAFSVFSRKLDYHSLQLGASRVVNPSLVLGVFGDAVIERGDQSKPYRYIPMFTPTAAAQLPAGATVTAVADARVQAKPLEQLPLSRDRFALTGRLAWRGTSTTLRLEERGYADSWGLLASTTDARYFIDLSRRWTIWPHVRFNVQNSVSFWERAYAVRDVHDLPALRTGDRELSQLFTVGGGGGVRIALGSTGRIDDVVLTATADGFYTNFADALYVKERFSALVTTAIEMVF